ncbi:MAG TPA: ABC transporter ATP-binding protein [Acidimicrobiales bacterium]|nr:ABC transporter ATP-binding protein [Acidimicrobiales bacterium]
MAEHGAAEMASAPAPAFGVVPGAGSPPLLDAQSISIRFGGVAALKDVSVCVEAGEAVGLVGPNGAGKTTLFNCMCGQLRPSSGTVSFDGHVLDDMPAHLRARLGIRRTFQRVEVFPELTARDHMIVAERARRGDGALWKDLLNKAKPRPEELAHVEEVLELVGLSGMADMPVAALSLGHCRLVELGRALCGLPRLLLADEPSSGLDMAETAALAAVLRSVQRERGMAVLLVEHDMAMVRSAVDRVVVLDVGEVIAQGTFEAVVADPEVRRAYLGRTA